MTYWDTSCLLKLYTPEENSEHLTALAEAERGPLHTSVLAETEMAFALARKESLGALRRGGAQYLFTAFRHDVALARLRLIPLDQGVRDKAVELAQTCLLRAPPLALRTLDGLHLATAATIRARILQTSDLRLRTAAAALGFQIRG